MAPQPESQQPSDAIDRRAQRGAPTPSPDNVRSWRPVLPLGHGSGLRPRNCRSAQHRPASAETARSEAADGTPGPRRTYPIRSRPGLGQHLEPPPVRGLFTGPPSRIQTRIHSTAPSPVEPALAALRECDRRARIRGARPVLPRRHDYRPEHIPQHLPEDWFTVLVEASIANPLPRSLRFRRAAAVQLVQIATGTSMADAATFLQIPETWFTGQRPQVAPLTALVLSKDFNVADAFETVIAHIGRAPDRIDYRERRRRFLFWRMSRESWETLVQELPGRPTSWSDTRRRACSAIIWTHLTGSEWRLAPDADPLPLNSDGTRRTRHARMELLLVNLRNNSPNNRATQAVLADYAASLLSAVPRHHL